MHLLQFSFRGSSLKNVRNGDAGIPVGEVRVVPASADCDTESVAGDPTQLNVMELPHDSLSALLRKKKKD